MEANWRKGVDDKQGRPLIATMAEILADIRRSDIRQLEYLYNAQAEYFRNAEDFVAKIHFGRLRSENEDSDDSKRDLLRLLDRIRYHLQEIRRLATKPDRRLHELGQAKRILYALIEEWEALSWALGMPRPNSASSDEPRADRGQLVYLPRRQGEVRSDPLDASISVNVYIDSNDENLARGVIEAAQGLAAVLGYEGVNDERILRGSIWRRARAVLRQGLSSRELRDRFVKVERALELRHLDASQAEVDSKEAEAVSTLIASLADIPNACVVVGSIFLIKFTTPDGPVIHSKCLSQVEIRALERFPEIQVNPRNALLGLSTAVANLEPEQTNASNG